MEFEIQGADKVVIDSIYNHIANAKKNLEEHVSVNPDLTGKESIEGTIKDLSGLLDLDKPFTFIVHDEEGLCEINPETDVKVEKL